MALKNYGDLRINELRKYVGKTYTVYEKLDMVYFKIHVDDNGAVLLNKKRQPITDVDFICNSMWGDIRDNALVPFVKHSKDVLDNYGPCTIGYFYLPVEKTKIISYPFIEPCTFIFSDVYFDNKDDIRPIDNITVPGFNPKPAPIIAINTLTETDIQNLGREDLTPVDIASMFIGNDETYSGNYLEDTDGVIIRFDKLNFQVPINTSTPNIDKFSKIIYRNLILTDFSNVTLSNKDFVNGVFSDNTDYVEIISEVFNHYMNNTEVFSKNDIEAVDLVPPIIGYLGHVDLESIKNTNTKIICKYNEVACNILRLMLMTFKNREINKKTNGINEEQRLKLIEFSKRFFKSK